MKFIIRLLTGLAVLACPWVYAAEHDANVELGQAAVYYDYHSTDTGTAVLTLNAVITETNDSLRGLKNTDRRRLGKLGQLIYQCKLMLYRPAGARAAVDAASPVLISKHYSLFTGVDQPLAADERIGICARGLREVDEASLFSASLGGQLATAEMWQTGAPGSVSNLRQLDVNLLGENETIESFDSIDIEVRFPVFQLTRPVKQWNYRFDLTDFRRAHRYIDENCTPVRLVELLASNG